VEHHPAASQAAPGFFWCVPALSRTLALARPLASAAVKSSSSAHSANTSRLATSPSACAACSSGATVVATTVFYRAADLNSVMSSKNALPSPDDEQRRKGMVR
jgi:hypothetical protein